MKRCQGIQSAGRFALILGLLGSACGGDAVGDTEKRAGELILAAPDTLVPDLLIGSESGRAEEAFGRIVDLEVDASGTIYVLDASVPALRIFRPDGAYVRSVGRAGEGPGEFRRPAALALAPDGTLWVYEDAARAVLELSPDGTEIARYGSRPSGPTGGPLSFIWDGAFASDGSLVQTVQHSDALPASATGVIETRNRLYVRSLDPGTGAVDSVLVTEDAFRRYRLRSELPNGGLSVSLGVVPIDARRLAAIDREGALWTALSTAYVLERRSPAGDTLVVRLDVAGEPFTAEQRASWEGGQGERLGLELPATAHVLWRLFTDDRDNLWVQRAAGFESTGRFDVFDPDGELIGSVLLPGRVAPFQTVVRGGDLYAVTYDELGVSRVIRAPVPLQR